MLTHTLRPCELRLAPASLATSTTVRWEPLETRILFSGHLDLVGTTGDDHIVVTAGNARGEVIVTGASGIADGTHFYGVEYIAIITGEGNDRVEVAALRSAKPHFFNRPLYVRYNTGAGDDTIVSSNRRDELHFEDASNIVSSTQGEQRFQDSTTGVEVRLDQGTVVDDGLGGTDSVSGIDEVYGTSFDDILQAGPDSNGTFYGGAGDDFIVIDNTTAWGMAGGRGDDTLIGTAGGTQEILDGGDDDDDNDVEEIDPAFGFSGLTASTLEFSSNDALTQVWPDQLLDGDEDELASL